MEDDNPIHGLMDKDFFFGEDKQTVEAVSREHEVEWSEWDTDTTLDDWLAFDGASQGNDLMDGDDEYLFLFYVSFPFSLLVFPPVVSFLSCCQVSTRAGWDSNILRRVTDVTQLV